MFSILAFEAVFYNKLKLPTSAVEWLNRRVDKSNKSIAQGLNSRPHCSLSAVTHAPFHASVLRPASQVGPMHEAAGMEEVS